MSIVLFEIWWSSEVVLKWQGKKCTPLHSSRAEGHLRCSFILSFVLVPFLAMDGAYLLVLCKQDSYHNQTNSPCLGAALWRVRVTCCPCGTVKCPFLTCARHVSMLCVRVTCPVHVPCLCHAPSNTSMWCIQLQTARQGKR